MLLLKWLVSKKAFDALTRELAQSRQDYQECQEAGLGVRTEYEALRVEHDKFKREVISLQEQIADLTGRHTALGFDEALARGLATKAIVLLRKIDQLGDNRKVTVALRKEIVAVLTEAQSAGLIEEESDA